MTIEIDRKEGTEPEFSNKKKKTVTLERRVIFGWWIFLVSVAAWMFYLGIIVGRESAPVYFDATQLDSDLMAMVSSAVNPESTDVVLPETTESQELEFFEALKDNKGGNKKIEELAALQSKSRLAAMQPERLPAKAANKDSDEEGEALTPPSDLSGNAHASKTKGALPGKPGEKVTASAKDVKSSQEKNDKKTDVKKPENIKAGEKKVDDSKAGAPKNDIKKSEKEKTADALKKESKVSVETAQKSAKDIQQKQEIKAVSASDKPKDPKKQADIKTTVQDTAAKKVEKPTESVALKNTDQAKTQPVVKEQPQKPVEPLKQEKSKDASAAKAGDAKSVTKTAEQQNVKKEQPKSGKYSIQAGAYTTQNDAAVYAKKLSNAGYSTSVVKGKGSDGKEWYRIRVGTYGDREKAVKMAETIKGAGFPAMVINVPQE